MKRVGLVGAAESWAHAPFHHPDWEIWSTSGRVADLLPRTDRHFEVHAAEQVTGQAYLEFLEQVEVWAFEHVTRNAIIYPRERVEARFGTEFLSSSIAWMFALAIDEGAECIGLWGIDMALDDEYAYQRPGCKHFMGLAKELGIDLVIPPDCPLLYDLPPYPDN